LAGGGPWEAFDTISMRRLKGILNKAANSEDDIFRCIEDGKVYISCLNYLFQYMGKEVRQND
jgi:hypothetical protein